MFYIFFVFDDEEDWYVERPSNETLRARSKRMMNKLKARGVNAEPVKPHGRNLAINFWGKEWMRSLAPLEQYYQRLSRGRNYLRQGCVIDVRVSPGCIDSKVMGEFLYDIHIEAAPPDAERIEQLRERCAGQIGSWVDLLKGRISEELMTILCEPESGLFPQAHDWQFSCTCPDWADVCKHVAATLYAFGVLLDDQPELLFTLRNMKAEDLIPAAPPTTENEENTLDADKDKLSDIFGIELG